MYHPPILCSFDLVLRVPNSRLVRATTECFSSEKAAFTQGTVKRDLKMPVMSQNKQSSND